ncbi:MAG: YdeI/OmpD-associated family protein [Acidimicrobiales bacterium]
MRASRSFTATVTRDNRRRVLVPVPFDPDEAWGRKAQHRVAGTVNGMGVRAVVEPLGDGFGIFLGPAWRRTCGLDAGHEVTVTLVPEGPQREDLAPDLRSSLDADPAAGAFFDSLAQFYRRGYLRYSTPPSGAPRCGPSASPRWWACAGTASRSGRSPDAQSERSCISQAWSRACQAIRRAA